MLEAKLRNLPKRLDLGTAPSPYYQMPTQAYQPPPTYIHLNPQQAMTFNQPLNSTIPKTYDTSKIIKLKDCDPNEIIYITKNRVVQESLIKVPVVSKSLEKPFKRPEKTQKAPQEQSKENEQLFNYQKLINERHSRKQKFLSDIERKISEAEKQANLLEEQFREEEEELKHIESLQGRINQKFHNQLVNQEVGKLQKEIEESEERKKVKKIELGMELDQIKRVIEVEQELDQRVIDEADDIINRVRGNKADKQTSIEKTKPKLPRPTAKIIAPTVSSFHATKKHK